MLSPSSIVRFLFVGAMVYYGAEYIGKPLGIWQTVVLALMIESYNRLTVTKGCYDGIVYANLAYQQKREEEKRKKEEVAATQ